MPRDKFYGDTSQLNGFVIETASLIRHSALVTGDTSHGINPLNSLGVETRQLSLLHRDPFRGLPALAGRGMKG